jgi:hypothetical protein
MQQRFSREEHGEHNEMKYIAQELMEGLSREFGSQEPTEADVPRILEFTINFLREKGMSQGEL